MTLGVFVDWLEARSENYISWTAFCYWKCETGSMRSGVFVDWLEVNWFFLHTPRSNNHWDNQEFWLKSETHSSFPIHVQTSFRPNVGFLLQSPVGRCLRKGSEEGIPDDDWRWEGQIPCGDVDIETVFRKQRINIRVGSERIPQKGLQNCQKMVRCVFWRDLAVSRRYIWVEKN